MMISLLHSRFQCRHATLLHWRRRWGGALLDDTKCSRLYDDRRNDRLNMKNKLVHFATHLLLLSSRLFTAALVTASYNTGLWVFFIFAFHYIPILKCDLVSLHVLVSLYAKIVRANKDTTDRVQLDSYSNPVEIAAL